MSLENASGSSSRIRTREVSKIELVLRRKWKFDSHPMDVEIKPSSCLSHLVISERKLGREIKLWKLVLHSEQRLEPVLGNPSKTTSLIFLKLVRVRELRMNSNKNTPNKNEFFLFLKVYFRSFPRLWQFSLWNRDDLRVLTIWKILANYYFHET